jgi:hypothetical protein
MEASLNGPSGNITLPSSALTIGRATDNQLVLSDPQSSSHHAEVRPDAQGYVIVDLNSTNGTFVNEQRLVPQNPRLLIPGDVIRIGATTFTYESPDSSDATLRAGDFAGQQYQPTVSAPPPGYNPASQPDYQSYQPPQAQAQPPSAYGNYEQGAQQSYPAYQQPQEPSYPAQQPGYQQPQYAPPQQNYPLPQAGYQQQWNAAPGQMAVPPVPATAAPPRRRRTGLIIGLVVLLLILVGGGIAGYLALRSTPEKTLTAFCTAVKNNDAQGAYNQFGTSITSRETEPQYATNFAKFEAALNSPLAGGLKDCAVSNVQQNGSTATGTITLSVNRTSTTLPINYTLDNENGSWKIQNATLPTQPGQ